MPMGHSILTERTSLSFVLLHTTFIIHAALITHVKPVGESRTVSKHVYELCTILTVDQSPRTAVAACEYHRVSRRQRVLHVVDNVSLVNYRGARFQPQPKQGLS